MGKREEKKNHGKDKKYAKELATITGNLKLSTSVALVLDRKLKLFSFWVNSYSV